MDIVEIFKALSNEKRLMILEWLKEPEKHFTPPVSEGADFENDGVCVTQLHQKLQVTQSTASQYLSILLRAGLLESRRMGKWTYYRRNEEMIKEVCHYLSAKL